MRPRPARLVRALTAAATLALLVPAAWSLDPGTTVTTSTVVQGTVAESVDAGGQVLGTEESAYRVSTTRSCRRTEAGPACTETQSRVAMAAAITASSTTALRGSSSSYGFLAANSRGPAHWNKCATVRYRVNPTGLPSGALTEVHTAMKKLAAASGLKVAYAGTTKVLPYAASSWANVPADQQGTLFVAWSTEAKVAALKGSVAGVGGPAYVSGGTREPRVYLGGVTLDAAAKVRPGFVDGASRGTLLLHELGHALNLNHVSDRYQVMHSYVTADSRPDYQAGDRAGLAKLAGYRCF